MNVINKQTMTIIVIVALIWFGVNYGFNVGMIQGTIGTNSVTLVSEDSSTIVYRIKTSADDGMFIDRGSATDGTFNSVGFGQTEASDSPIRYNDIQIIKYPLDKVKIEGARAIKNPSTSNEVELSDIRISNVKGWCKPSTESSIILDGKNDIRGQEFVCEITSADFKAYENGEEVPNVKFYGISSASVEVTTYKLGMSIPTETTTPSGTYTSTDEEGVTTTTTTETTPTEDTPTQQQSTDTQNLSLIDRFNLWVDGFINTILGWFS